MAKQPCPRQDRTDCHGPLDFATSHVLEGGRLEATLGAQGPLEESADARFPTLQNDKVLSLDFRSTWPLPEICSLIRAARHRG